MLNNTFANSPMLIDPIEYSRRIRLSDRLITLYNSRGFNPGYYGLFKYVMAMSTEQMVEIENRLNSNKHLYLVK